jgi:hypothetical protein
MIYNKKVSDILIKIGRADFTEVLTEWDRYRYKLQGTGKDSRHDEFMDAITESKPKPKPKVKKKKSPTPRRYGSNDSPKPYYNGESIQAIERNEGHGFWGNASSGYITDEQLNRMP